MLYRGARLLMRLFSRSSASPSERVTVTSTEATCDSIIWIRGLAACFWKYEPTRFLRSLALPTYSATPPSPSMRYTPGIFGSPATKLLGSNDIEAGIEHPEFTL